MNNIKENILIIWDAMQHEPFFVLLCTLIALGCFALAYLTTWLANKYEWLMLPVFVLCIVLIGNMYVDIVIAGINYFAK